MSEKGYKQTDQHRDKIRQKLKGNKNGAGNKGKIRGKQSEEHIRKKTKYPRFFICQICGKEIKNTDGSQLRKFCSQKCNGKNRLGKSGKKGRIAWNKGKKFPEKSGANCHLWKGGIYKSKYPTSWTEDLRESIRKRDNYKCKICDVHQNNLKSRDKKLDVHHISYDKNNLNPKNLISLCRSCHAKTSMNRNYWADYFNQYP